ncbi:MAG TPA: tetratricopeptide repeat protein [Candidatus Sulfotelmatobacter sp.]|nr:tetratricopeptide repeat protein [Candidatus Sulfotelmatobacter sp.]
MSFHTSGYFYRSLLSALCVFYFGFCASAAGQMQPSTGWSQTLPPPPPDYTNVDMMRVLGVKVSDCEQSRGLLVTILDEQKAKLDRQAVVKIHDKRKDTTTWLTTSHESQLVFCGVEPGAYDLEASAVGYLIDRQELQIGPGTQNPQVEIILHKDPLAVDLSNSDAVIPPKQRKDAKRAVLALKSANYKEAEKKLDKVYKAAPSSVQVNFLYGYLFVQLNDLAKAEGFLGRAAELDSRRVQTLALLGRVQLQLKEDDRAQKTLEHAVVDDPKYWIAHNLLADAYLRHKEYEKAREQAQLAIHEGQAAGTVAQLILGEALANLGHDQEGIQALKTFLETNPGNPVVPEVRNLISTLEQRDSGAGGATELVTKSDLALDASVPSLPESTWGPPGVDDAKPPVVPGVPCPYQQVLDGTGERVKQLVSNIEKFAAIEDLLHQQLDKTGNPISTENWKFNYVAQIKENPPGSVGIEEYRGLRYGATDLPGNIVTKGFITLALTFLPGVRDDFQMSCEGVGNWRGQTAWLMHFQQREDKPSRFAGFVIGNRSYPMKLKGRAWIATDNMQIVRIESDLLSPVPHMTVIHQIAEYGPVHFKKMNTDLWLPQHVDIFMELNRRYYHRQHSFDHFMLFAVDSQDKGPLKNQGAGDGIKTP